MPATTTKLLTLATISMSLQVRRALLFGRCPTFPLFDGWPGQGEDERGPVLGRWNLDSPCPLKYPSSGREVGGETQTALESSKAPGGGRAHLHRAHLLADLAVWYKAGRYAHVGSLRVPGLACDLEKDPSLWVHAALASWAGTGQPQPLLTPLPKLLSAQSNLPDCR